MAIISVLDVGHGNCTVIQDAQNVIIDAGFGDGLLNFLQQARITRIDQIMVSHADSDHLRGLIALLSLATISIGKLYLNTDSTRSANTDKFWKDVIFLIEDAIINNRMDENPVELYRTGALIDIGEFKLEVVYPTYSLIKTGPGGISPDGHSMSSNGLSAVIKVLTTQVSALLLPGDVDEFGLEQIKKLGFNIEAQVAVFPHHGGNADTNNLADFTTHFCQLVSPNTVLFSTGRGKYGTPRMEIVSTIKALLPLAYISCTQLSKSCAKLPPLASNSHLNAAFAKGKSNNSCCGGTFELNVTNATVTIVPKAAHESFVNTYVPLAVCRIYPN
ncbi:ComEC/Rec2 family competence protein [Hymenobacter siberiensis]|uniref:ComEC/Rec2 family competence protein n=1 Tax=Hymenobacter siberiensis TaxID=2848396 RepID=UPI001C1E2FE6|nr:MBL fold metallo-hydrolase [Hymenobacter siberiensis]